MANDYFQDQHSFTAEHPLPSPSGTPYHSLSQRSSRYGTPGSGVPSSPLPLPSDDFDGTENSAVDENISVLDPRRFTPTLHASLVAEILSLRRELESKHTLIDELEHNLDTARNDNDALVGQLSASTKEGRVAKRQLQQLEHGTLSALEELAAERDKTKEANSDLRIKLDGAQKKIRSQEEDSNRVHDLWARDKELWDGQKRALERRVHISESRLKMLVDELAAQRPENEDGSSDSEGEDVTRDSGVGHESDTASVRSSPQRRPSTRLARHSRNQSNGSYRSIGRNYRLSYMSGVGSDAHSRQLGLSLADELTFDEEEEDLGDLELDSDDFPENEMRARRALESRQSMYPDEKAKRILGLANEQQQQTAKDMQSAATEPEISKLNGTALAPTPTTGPQEVDSLQETLAMFAHPKPQYVDTAVQYSPPPSPVRPESAEPSKLDDSSNAISEVEANQSRKRVSAVPYHVTVTTTNVPTLYATTSTSSQTTEHPLSPPATPKLTFPVPLTPISPVFKAEVVSTATQTEPAKDSVPKQPTRAPPPPPIPVPSIAIHPPLSAPPSPKEPILPPGTKNVATQTMGDLVSPMRSTAMQTEPIRVDKRPIKLPAHLLPSAISSKPNTPEPGIARTVSGEDVHMPVAHKSAEGPTVRQDLVSMLENAADARIEDRYPGNNDNGPLARDGEEGIRRPFRSSSLFAGFEGPSSDEEDNEADFSEDDFRVSQLSTPMVYPRKHKHSRVFTNPPTPVPEEKEVVSTSRPSEDSTSSARMYANQSHRNSLEKSAKVGKPIRAPPTRQPSIRRSALIQSGTAAHLHRSRSPSLGSIASSSQTGGNGVVPQPPFPVPTRSSSRRIPFSKSEGSQSPTPRGGSGFASRRTYGARTHQRKDSLRKVRSAAVIHRTARSRSRSPPYPITPVVPESPGLPPLPSDMVGGQRFGHRRQPSVATTQTATGSLGSSGQQASVVDAIAATMVGEWMWKYVRKRKTFGGPESPVGEDSAVMAGNGVRHKRWVWISPYERAVMWSSKQPTTGSALMGKSGRKLTIQSVLDVADNTPSPRGVGAQALFNRSILILTPARALKFTTASRERHYLWLTALSFLAHSNSPIPDLGPPSLEPEHGLSMGMGMAMPGPPPISELPPRNGGATLRRTHVRDSVRLAKGKANPVTQRLQGQSDWNHFDRAGGVGVDDEADAADPPSIPRGPHHHHGRKRSSTGPRAPPPPGLGLRSFSHQHVPSLYSTGSSDLYTQPPSVPSSIYNPPSVMTSSRPSDASSSIRHNFFDSMGTVRMEAFIEPMLSGQDGLHSPSAMIPKPRVGRRRGNSQWSSSTHDAHRTGGLYEDFMHDAPDPFRGF